MDKIISFFILSFFLCPLLAEGKIVGEKDFETVASLKKRAFFDSTLSGEELFRASNIKDKPSAGLYKATRPVAILKYTKKKGEKYKKFHATGFMISRTLMLTNYHSLGEWSLIGKARARFGYLEKGKYEAFQIEKVIMADYAFDYAILKMKGKKNKSGRTIYPGDKYGVLPLGIYPRPRKGQKIYIVSHPGGEPKQYCRRESRIIKTFKRRFYHTADTLSGSSGSPILNERFEAIGLHYRGSKNRKTGKYFNKAFRMDFIWKRMGGYARPAVRYMRNTPGTIFYQDRFKHTLGGLFRGWEDTRGFTRQHPITGKLLSPKRLFYAVAIEKTVAGKKRRRWWVYIKPHWFLFRRKIKTEKYVKNLEKAANLNGRFQGYLGAYFLPELHLERSLLSSAFEVRGKIKKKKGNPYFKDIRPVARDLLHSHLSQRWIATKSSPPGNRPLGKEKAHWVYAYPFLFLYRDRVSSKEERKIYLREYRRAKKGKKYRYRKPLKAIKFPYYYFIHGRYYEYPYLQKRKENWMGSGVYPEGYWVYSFPYWFIFRHREKR